ncbi:hypothetical protein C464_11555 [Halorubrum coriense DSM 10284]|uniref:CASTOR ACT domain-containing protein n=1 Tax=Halorubrum coriense DSM 10284 TaxID=1227466 RepID=M0EGG5_9EURY|nr:ACT domain-containing protein [Halorubrum coriense]ELZ45972.1 hypothetical protein C464_11555 [Halorubrum coriense DSM 10284]
MDPAEFLEDGTVSVSEETYAVCRTDGDRPDAFATVREANETTVVVEQGRVDAVAADAVEHGWKRLTFEMELPFELVGFLAAVATALAEVDVSVFVVSSYATDHVFVKERDLSAAVRRLKSLDCEVGD